MERIGDSLSRKRFGGGGLFLLLLLLALLLVPLLRDSDVDHPLAGRELLDVCALLAPLADDLARLQPRPGNGNCDLLDRDGQVVLTIGLSSNRSVAAGSRHGTTEMYATWVKEVAVSGATEMRELPGPWRSATGYRQGSSWQLLVEDGGLLIVLMSPRLEHDALLARARILVPALRGR